MHADSGLSVITTEPTGPKRSTPIIFIHGAWHGAWCWTEHLTGYFADRGYQSHAIDLRGHGDSSGSLRRSSIGNYVDDVRTVADSLTEPAVLIGHSMGGFVAQHYLARHRAAAGVLMASVPPSGALGITTKVARQRPGTFLKVNATMSLWPLVADPDEAASLFFGQDLATQEARRHTDRLQDESYLAYLGLIMNLPRASRVQDPMLVLGAGQDALISRKMVNATASRYGTEAIFFDDMSHDMMLDTGWEQPAATIADWVDVIE